MNELITESFRSQALSFPNRVDGMLAEIKTVVEAKDILDKAAVMHQYAKRLKVGIECERPIAIAVLKIKAALGELMPAKSPSERGSSGGRGNKASSPAELALGKEAKAAYRKIAKNKDKLDEYLDAVSDVPTQGGFLKWTKNTHVANNSCNNEWYTPPKFIEAAREVMGSIDLDPATSKVAQETVIGSFKSLAFCWSVVSCQDWRLL